MNNRSSCVEEIDDPFRPACGISRGLLYGVFSWFIIFIGCLLLLSCGQIHYADISKNTVIWKGSIIESAYNQDFLDANACAETLFGYRFSGIPPKLVMVDGPFICGGESGSWGCFDAFFNEMTIDLSAPYINHTVRHEELHRITRMGNEGHDTPVFQRCEGPLDATGRWDWITNTVK